MDDFLGLGLAFLGLAAYGKHVQAGAARERKELQAQDAIDALRERAQQLHDAVQDMEIDLIAEPGKHSAKSLRAAQQRADRAQEALLLAQARM